MPPQGHADVQEGLRGEGRLQPRALSSEGKAFPDVWDYIQVNGRLSMLAVSRSSIQVLSRTYQLMKKKMPSPFQRQSHPDDNLAVCAEQRRPFVCRL